MAGSARYMAILDANVLYPQLVRDTLLSLVKDRPELVAKLALVVERMAAHGVIGYC